MSQSRCTSSCYGSGKTPRLDELADAAETTPYLPELRHVFRPSTGHGSSGRNEGQPDQRVNASSTNSFENNTASQHRRRQRLYPALLLRSQNERYLRAQRARALRTAASANFTRQSSTSQRGEPSPADPTSFPTHCQIQISMEGVDVSQGTQPSDPAAVAPAIPRITLQMALRQRQQQQQQVPAVEGLNTRFKDEMLNNKEGKWEEEFCKTT